jgi:hypothetical protein
MMTVNDPEVLAEVTAAVDAYETALMTNDVEALDGFFRDAPRPCATAWPRISTVSRRSRPFESAVRAVRRRDRA